MKAAAFDYVRATSLGEVCGYLADDGIESRIIAGGQSLVPMMAMRLVRPELLIDINGIEGLSGIRRQDGRIAIGAATRQAALEWDDAIQSDVPLMALALPFIGHDQTRNRGTVGGSLAHADPSAEIGLVATTLDATVMATDGTSEREIGIADFLLGPMTSDLDPSECMTEVLFPVWDDGRNVGAGFQEVSSRDSDFAIVAAAAQVTLDGDGACQRAACAIANAAPTPLRLTALEEALIGERPSEALLSAHISLIDDALDPSADLHASTSARFHMARSLMSRAILQAAENAAKQG